MKKILTFVFILVLILCLASCEQENENLQPEHKVHLDENSDGLCDGCNGVMINNSDTSLISNMIKDSLEKQFNEAKSMKLDIEYKTISESESWYYDSYYDYESNTYIYSDIPLKNTYYNESDGKVEIWLSKTKEGVNAKIITNVKSRSFPDDEFGESTTETIYYIDGYQYSYLNNGYFIKSDMNGTMGDLLAKLTRVELLDEDAKDELLSALSTELATVYNVQNHQGSISIDAKPTIDQFVDYFSTLDWNKNTTREIIDYTLNQISPDLNSKAILQELRRLSDLTVTDALAELDKWLTENHQTTLQEIIDKVVNDPGAFAIIETYIINSNYLDPNDAADKEIIDELLSKVKNFNINTFINEQGVSEEIVFSLISRSLPPKSEDESTGERVCYTADDVFDNIDYMLNISINELVEYLGNYSIQAVANYTSLIHLISNLDVNECNLKVDLNFDDLFTLVSIEGGLNIDCEIYTLSSVEDKVNYQRSFIKADFKISEIGSEEKDISIHRTATIINNRYTNGKSYVNVCSTNSEKLYLSFSIYDETTGNTIETSINMYMSNANREITEYINWFNIVTDDTYEYYSFYNSQPISFVLYHENGTFTITRMPDWSKASY